MSKYLGLDVSTQSLTALVLDLEHGGLLRHSLNYDHALPHYATQNGVRPDPDPNVARVDPLMWAEALDQVLAWLRGFGLARNIRGISVSAQQHGSVYLNRHAPAVLAELDHKFPYHAQLDRIFSRKLSPIWMDASTSTQCAEINQALGGGRAAARLTGSVATERFAGPQIRRFYQEHPELYEQTAHIALVSSFITSLLTGRIAPLDCGDGLGMNLADAEKRQWSKAALQASAPLLIARLPGLLKQDQLAGRVSPYLCRRFGLAPDCQVSVGTGDNPASLAGLGLVGNEKVRAISLGTSDTYFGYSASYMTGPRDYGHIFGAADGGYMFLLCFKNGSLAREQLKQDHGLSWEQFSSILMESRPGNRGRVMLPYFAPEITPAAPGGGRCVMAASGRRMRPAMCGRWPRPR
jgi:xylulokinase